MLIEIVVLLLGIPVGFLIAYWANDELVSGRRWFVGLMILSGAAILVFGLMRNYVVSWTAGFIFIVTAVSLWKSFDKKWTRRRI